MNSSGSGSGSGSDPSRVAPRVAVGGRPYRTPEPLPATRYRTTGEGQSPNMKVMGNTYEIRMRIRMNINNREKIAVGCLIAAIRSISQRHPDLAVKHAQDAIGWLAKDSTRRSA